MMLACKERIIFRDIQDPLFGLTLDKRGYCLPILDIFQVPESTYHIECRA